MHVFYAPWACTFCVNSELLVLGFLELNQVRAVILPNDFLYRFTNLCVNENRKRLCQEVAVDVDQAVHLLRAL